MMNVLLQIQQNIQSYTLGQKKIAKYIIENPQELLSMSVQELAAKLDTSSASLVRFSKMLGLKGFTDLKQRVSAGLSKISNTDSLKEIDKGDSVAEIKKKVLIRMDYMVQQVNKVLDNKQVERAAQLIRKSEYVFSFGLGASSLAAQDISQKFSRIGKQAVFNTDITLIATSMTLLKNKSCLIAVSNSGETTEVVKICNLAESLGIPVIGITQQINSKVASKSQIILTPSSGEKIPVRTAATMSLMAQLYVVDILFYDYVANNFETSMTGIHQTKNIEL